MSSHNHSHPPAGSHRHAHHHSHAASAGGVALFGKSGLGLPVYVLMAGLGGRLLALLPVLALLWALIAWAILSE